ncbi:hypothetical protein BGP_0192 [Beggiatoa sp. PS]|nr:hypothetical protein BGP_0192 [Beggiatoa sp. PS]
MINIKASVQDLSYQSKVWAPLKCGLLYQNGKIQNNEANELCIHANIGFLGKNSFTSFVYSV